MLYIIKTLVKSIRIEHDKLHTDFIRLTGLVQSQTIAKLSAEKMLKLLMQNFIQSAKIGDPPIDLTNFKFSEDIE